MKDLNFKPIRLWICVHVTQSVPFHFIHSENHIGLLCALVTLKMQVFSVLRSDLKINLAVSLKVRQFIYYQSSCVNFWRWNEWDIYKLVWHCIMNTVIISFKLKLKSVFNVSHWGHSWLHRPTLDTRTCQCKELSMDSQKARKLQLGLSCP